MKTITIDYYRTAEREVPYGAKTEYMGACLYAHGASAEQAKKRLLEKIISLDVALPPRETVNLEEPEPELDLESQGEKMLSEQGEDL